MTPLGDILFATNAEGERVFDDDIVDHALPYVLYMVAFPLDQMPERARLAFTGVIQRAGVVAADNAAAILAKLGAFYEATPIDDRLFAAVMSWMRQELREAQRDVPKANANYAERLGLNMPPKAVPSQGGAQANATAAGPLARFALNQNK